MCGPRTLNRAGLTCTKMDPGATPVALLNHRKSAHAIKAMPRRKGAQSSSGRTILPTRASRSSRAKRSWGSGPGRASSGVRGPTAQRRRRRSRSRRGCPDQIESGGSEGGSRLFGGPGAGRASRSTLGARLGGSRRECITCRSSVEEDMVRLVEWER